MKKIITTKGTEFEQNYKDLVMIETAERGGLPTMLSSEELNEGFSNAEQDVRDKIGFDVNGEDITVNPATDTQIIKPSEGKNAILKVTVNPVELQNKNINPTTESQEITSDEGYMGLSSVTINAVDSTIDNNIQVSNIKTGVTILGVEGDVIELDGETAQVTPTTSEQTITPQTGNGLTEVTVSAVDATIDANITPENIVLGKTILNVEGSTSKLAPYYLSLCSLTLPTGVNLQTYINGIDWSNLNGFGNLLEGITDTIDTLDLSAVHNSNLHRQYMDAPWMCAGVRNIRKIILPKNIIFKLSSGIRGPISFQSMFGNCSKLEEIENLDTWTISNASYQPSDYPIGVDFRNMFSNCVKLKKVLLSSLNIAGGNLKAKGTRDMFYGCSSLELLDLGTIRFDASSDAASINPFTPLNYCIILTHNNNTLAWLHNLLLNTPNKEESYTTWNTSGHVHFNLNGGSYSDYKYQYGVAETVVTLPTNITPPTGKVFDHWEDSEGNTLTTYTIQSRDIGKDIEVYAIYEDA